MSDLRAEIEKALHKEKFASTRWRTNTEPARRGTDAVMAILAKRGIIPEEKSA